MRHWLLFSVLTLCFPAHVPGQEWARKMFNKTSHDFGMVARGSEVKYTFTIENIYEEDAHISGVRTSCRCTVPKPSKHYLKTWDKAELIVDIDTRTDPGQKDATITVTFDKPFPAEVQLHTHAYLRSDVVVRPGVVQFGTVDPGVGWRQQATVSFAGRSDWKILRVESNNPHLTGQVVEKYRRPGKIAYDVGYDLQVTLDAGTPSGYLREEIYLITNDVNPRAARVPVTVEGLVASRMSVRPNPLSFGAVRAGQSVSRNLIIQSKTPFRILGILTTDNRRLRCNIPQDSKPVHLLPVTFAAPDTEGKFQGTLRIKTDQEQVGPLDVKVDAQVLPPK
ncbi:MAG: DUF1573 domain-containing protein [Pirellulales bacterium]|nr:DUF1573 domain-containing protein [Pirellulales bacterium]